MTTLDVGNGQQYSTISAAVAASSSGDTVNVDAGTYTNDFISISHDLTLNAVGGTVSLVATTQPPNGKGIIDAGAPGAQVTINGFDISGAAVPDGNGAGIRYEGGNLTLNQVNIHDNQEGLLANPDPNGTITINGSTFNGNGTGDGFTHNIYVGDIAQLTVQDSTITAANIGHDIKSRAETTNIINNRIGDGATGNSSYEIDLPNGGNALIEGNTIEKGVNAVNHTAIAFGEEGGVYANSSLSVLNNTLQNDNGSSSTVAVWNATGLTADLTGNTLSGWATVVSGLANISGNAADLPAFIDPALPPPDVSSPPVASSVANPLAAAASDPVSLAAAVSDASSQPYTVAAGSPQDVSSGGAIGHVIGWEVGQHNAPHDLAAAATGIAGFVTDPVFGQAPQPAVASYR